MYSEGENMDYEILDQLIKIPDRLDRTIKKEQISKQVRDIITARDNYTCQLCGLKDQYGNSK